GMSQNRLFVIDGAAETIATIRDIAEAFGYDVAHAHNAGEFRRTFRQFEPTVVMLDLQMRNEDGIYLLRFLADQHYLGKVIVSCGFDTKVLSTAARLATSYGLKKVRTLQKPLAVSDLETALREPLRSLDMLTANELKQGIARGQIVVHYQPKIMMPGGTTRKLVGLEAVARWEHPRLGLIAPKDFIRLAEETGHMERLTNSVIRSAAEQARNWRMRGISITLAVNLAESLLADADFPVQLLHLIRDYDVPSTEVMLEVSESSVKPNSHMMTEALTRLRLAGFGLSLDDFGTGRSSLIELYRMPFSELKIDESFVTEMTRTAEAQVIVKSVIDLAHNLGMTACAEGVEDKETADLLARLGCDYAQGYLYGAPVPAKDVEALLRSWPIANHANDRRGAAGMRRKEPEEILIPNGVAGRAGAFITRIA
ncbi:MAG: EAL domain-containing protein, partial [Methyloligellaceae bacterium]